MQTVSMTEIAPGGYLSSRPVKLRVVQSQPRVAENQRGARAIYDVETDFILMVTRDSEEERHSTVSYTGKQFTIKGTGIYR